jgi:hypothetical protein
MKGILSELRDVGRIAMCTEWPQGPFGGTNSTCSSPNYIHPERPWAQNRVSKGTWLRVSQYSQGVGKCKIRFNSEAQEIRRHFVSQRNCARIECECALS